MTKYTIEIQKPSGETEYIPMQGARTDAGAARRMKWFIKEPEARQGLVYLSWFDQRWGTRGYINPDGNAGPYGKPWEVTQ